MGLARLPLLLLRRRRRRWRLAGVCTSGHSGDGAVGLRALGAAPNGTPLSHRTHRLPPARISRGGTNDQVRPHSLSDCPRPAGPWAAPVRSGSGRQAIAGAAGGLRRASQQLAIFKIIDLGQIIVSCRNQWCEHVHTAVEVSRDSGFYNLQLYLDIFGEHHGVGDCEAGLRRGERSRPR